MELSKSIEYLIYEILKFVKLKKLNNESISIEMF